MRILINIEKGFIQTIDYQNAMVDFMRNGGNVGNKVFAQSIYNLLNVPGNQISLVELDDELNILNYSYDEINEKFDLFVFATVIFGMGYAYKKNIQTYTKIINQLSIPVFCFSVGTQAQSYDSLNQLVESTRDVAVPFIKRIISLNGYMALRGFFTREYFTKLGFNQFEVTGCPSMYQKGRDLIVEKKDYEKFRCSINGTVDFLRSPFVRKNVKRYGESEYLDQDQFVELIYGEDRAVHNIGMMQRYSYLGLKLYGQDRLHMICNYNEWEDYFISNHVSFSIGGRIHGNIIAMLTGIPAFVCYHDSRTREMAEFFNIPCADVRTLGKKDVCDLYESADYSEFNRTYKEKFDTLDVILSSFGIPHVLGKVTESSCLKNKPEYPNYENEFNKCGCRKMKLWDVLFGQYMDWHYWKKYLN